MQATAYCRIRYTAGDDFKRAERQRTVLMEVAKKAKTANVGTLNNIINEVFPKIKTSFSTAEMISYAADATKYTVVDNTGFPMERVTGKMGKAGSSVVANNLVKNVTDLHSFLFGATDYVPTATVQAVSDKVASDKATYLGN
jgi:anionic cell wall polymer biosynthesis LytR-Cps2A-Psr (LCP) family protein